jgi:hypothetical protein
MTADSSACKPKAAKQPVILGDDEYESDLTPPPSEDEDECEPPLRRLRPRYATSATPLPDPHTSRGSILPTPPLSTTSEPTFNTSAPSHSCIKEECGASPSPGGKAAEHPDTWDGREGREEGDDGELWDDRDEDLYAEYGFTTQCLTDAADGVPTPPWSDDDDDIVPLGPNWEPLPLASTNDDLTWL